MHSTFSVVTYPREVRLRNYVTLVEISQKCCVRNKCLLLEKYSTFISISNMGKSTAANSCQQNSLRQSTSKHRHLVQRLRSTSSGHGYFTFEHSCVISKNATRVHARNTHSTVSSTTMDQRCFHSWCYF